MCIYLYIYIYTPINKFTAINKTKCRNLPIDNPETCIHLCFINVCSSFLFLSLFFFFFFFLKKCHFSKTSFLVFLWNYKLIFIQNQILFWYPKFVSFQRCTTFVLHVLLFFFCLNFLLLFFFFFLAKFKSLNSWCHTFFVEIYNQIIISIMLT